MRPWSLGDKRGHSSEKPILKYFKQQQDKEEIYWICQVLEKTEEEERVCEAKLKGSSDTTLGNTFLEVKLIF